GHPPPLSAASNTPFGCAIRVDTTYEDDRNLLRSPPIPHGRGPRSATMESGPADPPANPAQARSVQLRVLAAEDNDVNQLVLRTLLSQAGLTPVMVENGRGVLEAWEAQSWDIILMDIQMPVMDGVAATREIRAREAETGRARTPIIAVTANAMVHQVAEYKAAGMDGMAAKPIDVTRLFHAMEQAMEPACPGAPERRGVWD
ncbi:MAG: response regulator, partial [Proteobacteria bacterium]|nr:response regulator [Pseudomonadota bacterium]